MKIRDIYPAPSLPEQKSETEEEIKPVDLAEEAVVQAELAEKARLHRLNEALHLPT